MVSVKTNAVNQRCHVGNRICIQERKLSKLFLLPSLKGSALKGKNLLPFGEYSFLLEWEQILSF